MKIKDFREITETYIETARKIIELKGNCKDIDCGDCPFHSSNSTNYYECEGVYTSFGIVQEEEDEKLLQSAKKFLKMCEQIDKKVK